MSCQECEKVKSVLARLVNLYVANIGTDSEFIACITPKSGMLYFQRRRSAVWSAWDDARAILGGKYTAEKGTD